MLQIVILQAVLNSCMDLISSLPLEVVELILSFLHIEDLLRCRLVCRNWDCLLVSPGLERLWITTCYHQLNLSPEKFREYHEHLSLHVLAAVALKHRTWLKSLISQVDSISTDKACKEENLKANVRSFLAQQRLGMRRVPQLNLSAPTCFLGHNFVFTEYSSSAGEKSPSLSHINPINKSLRSCPSNPLSNAPNLLRSRWVYWTLATPTYVLMLIQPDGQWIGYCPLTDKILLNKKMVRSQAMLTSGCVGVACCRKCFTVVTVGAFSNESDLWNLTVIRAGKPAVTDQKEDLDIYDSRTILIRVNSGETVVAWKLIPHFSSRSVNSSGYCTSHTLICITNAKIVLYKMSIVSPADSSPTSIESTPLILMEKLDTTDLPKPALTESLQVQNVCLSNDGHLLGVLVDPFQFCVWNIMERCKFVTSTDVSTLHAPNGVGEQATHARIIAIGHLYSVVATFDSKPGGQISIVATQSGRLVCQRPSRVQWFVVNNQDYLHLVNEDWLNDLRCFNGPFFMYVNQSVLRSHSSQNLSYVQFVKLF